MDKVAESLVMAGLGVVVIAASLGILLALIYIGYKLFGVKGAVVTYALEMYLFLATVWYFNI